MDSFSDKLQSKVGLINTALAGIGLYKIKGSVQAFGEQEELMTNFTRAFADNAGMMLTEAKKFAKETALSMSQVAGLYTSIKFTPSIKLDDDGIKQFTENYTKVLYGFGVGKNFDPITLQIKQMLTKPNLMRGDMIQISNWGLPILSLIEQATGIDTAAKGALENLTADDLIKTFEVIANDPKNKNVLKQYQQGQLGSQDLLAGSFSELSISIGRMFSRGLQIPSTFRSMSAIVDTLTEKIDGLSIPMQKFVSILAGSALVIPPLLLGFSAITKMVALLGGGLLSTVKLGSTLVSILNAPIVGIANATNDIALMRNAYGSIDGILIGINSKLLIQKALTFGIYGLLAYGVASALTGTLDPLEQMAQFFNTIKNVVGFIGAGVEFIYTAIKYVIEGALLLLNEVITKAGSFFGKDWKITTSMPDIDNLVKEATIGVNYMTNVIKEDNREKDKDGNKINADDIFRKDLKELTNPTPPPQQKVLVETKVDIKLKNETDKKVEIRSVNALFNEANFSQLTKNPTLEHLTFDKA